MHQQHGIIILLVTHHLDKLQRPSGISTICQKKLQADHISFRTYLSVRMAVTSRTQEKCSSVPVLQGSTWTGMNFSILQDAPDTVGTDTFTVMSSHIDAYKFSFLPRTKDSDRLERSSCLRQSQAVYWCLQESPPQVPRHSCWPLLSRATPAVMSDQPSLDIH